MKKKTQQQPPRYPAVRQNECAGCSIYRETIAFLRDQVRSMQLQNDQLQNKLLALTGDAADRYQKLRVMELAQQNSPSFSGVLPPQEDAAERDEFDEFTSALHEGLGKLGGRAS